jgi:hypothetical protein
MTTPQPSGHPRRSKGSSRQRASKCRTPPAHERGGNDTDDRAKPTDTEKETADERARNEGAAPKHGTKGPDELPRDDDLPTDTKPM